MLMNPGYPIYSYTRFLARADDEAPDRAARIALTAERTTVTAPHDKPLLTVFVLGETARSDRFSLNGYARDTNRYTRAREVVSFPRVTSCGTSTADSVPCMFSGLGKAAFSHAAAAAHESLFLTLERLGVAAFWRDNSTGCKAVCDAEHFEQLAARTDARHCDSTGCFDEILLEDIETLVADRARDHFIVLHQRGSHGPAYHTDAPGWSKVFVPECDLPNLRNCSAELINNAYDNTIVYTDFFVARVIDFLEGQADAFDVAMIYVSDHGESLGENGLYLHGFPYAIAPQEQVRVPMLLWASPGFYARGGVERSCLESVADRDYSHDSIFHTLLAIYDVQSPVYEPDLDLLAACRRGPNVLAREAPRSRPREIPTS
jgi:lipid A ethanolaminephosphotransferase